MTDPRYEEAAWRAIELIRSELDQADEQMEGIDPTSAAYAYAKGRYDAARAILVVLQIETEADDE